MLTLTERRQEEMKALFTEHLAHWVSSGPALPYTRQNKVSQMVLVTVKAEVEEEEDHSSWTLLSANQDPPRLSR